jgi:hypothetical protein
VRAFVAAVLALVLGLSIPYAASPANAASTGQMDIDCDTNAELLASLQALSPSRIRKFGDGASAVWVIGDLTPGNDDLQSDDDILFKSIASTGACVVSKGTALDLGAGLNSVNLLRGDYGMYPVAGSGSFTLTSAGADPVAVTIYVDACSLAGSGISQDPWRVASKTDFREIANTIDPQSCVSSGHYLQTADIVLDDFALDQVPAGFSGVYDGDHYGVVLARNTSVPTKGWGNDLASGGPVGLFVSIIGGTVRKLRLSGEIVSAQETVGGLAQHTGGDAVISEVSSEVTITSVNSATVGGIVGEFVAGDSRVQYSRYVGTMESTTATSGCVILGGIVGERESEVDLEALPPVTAGARLVEIRDSYSRASFTVNSQSLSCPGLWVGGLVGYLDTPIEGGSAMFVRNYSASSVNDGCVASCATPAELHFGSLAGRDELAWNTVWVSNFYQQGGGFTKPYGGAAVSAAYIGSRPVAVSLSAALLKYIATYQSKEAGSTQLPSGSSDLVEAASNRSSVQEQDYRWAIEPIIVQTFVPSSYAASPSVGELGTLTEQRNYLNRNRYPSATPMATATYLTKRLAGTTDLTLVSAHRGRDAATTSDYPLLGRVWDICDDYPTLVWEEEDSCTGGGGGNNSAGNNGDDSNPGGLSDAEYAEFLRSGLTLADFLARRLAATGPSDAALGLVGLSAALLGLVGAALVLIARRQVSRKPR